MNTLMLDIRKSKSSKTFKIFEGGTCTHLVWDAVVGIRVMLEKACVLSYAK